MAEEGGADHVRGSRGGGGDGGEGDDRAEPGGADPRGDVGGEGSVRAPGDLGALLREDDVRGGGASEEFRAERERVRAGTLERATSDAGKKRGMVQASEARQRRRVRARTHERVHQQIGGELTDVAVGNEGDDQHLPRKVGRGAVERVVFHREFDRGRREARDARRRAAVCEIARPDL